MEKRIKDWLLEISNALFSLIASLVVGTVMFAILVLAATALIVIVAGVMECINIV